MAGGTARDRVTARLTQLRGAYDGFDIQQTTVSVDRPEFERLRTDGSGAVHAEIDLVNDDGDHLLVEGEDGPERPSATIGAGQPLAETACAAVERTTGIRPEVTGLERAAIVCIDCEELDESAYQLQVIFTATPESGSVTSPARWRADAPPNPV